MRMIPTLLVLIAAVVVFTTQGCASAPTDEPTLTPTERQVIEDLRYGLDI